MNGKTVNETQLTLAQQMLPSDANPAGNVHGGVIMKLIDTAAGIVCVRHSGSNVVTASIDRLDFMRPAYLGEILIIKAALNMVGKTSMEAGCRVEAENPHTGEVRHAASAYLTFVALDDDKRPRAVPPLILEGPEQQRRNRQAMDRRQVRLAERQREAQLDREMRG